MEWWAKGKQSKSESLNEATFKLQQDETRFQNVVKWFGWLQGNQNIFLTQRQLVEHVRGFNIQ